MGENLSEGGDVGIGIGIWRIGGDRISTSCLCGDCSRRISLLGSFLIQCWCRVHYRLEYGLRRDYYYFRGWLHLRK